MINSAPSGARSKIAVSERCLDESGKVGSAKFYPSKTQICRAITAARNSGLDVAEIEVRPDGSIRVGEARATSKPSNDFDRWEAQL